MARATMKRADILVSLILFPVCLYVFYESTKWPKEALIGAPTLIPRGVAFGLLVAAVALLTRAVTGRALALEEKLVGENRRRVILASLLTGGYAFIVTWAGFLITTFSFLFLFGLIVGERRWVRLVLFAAVVPVVIYLIFAATLNVPLPPGFFR